MRPPKGFVEGTEWQIAQMVSAEPYCSCFLVC